MGGLGGAFWDLELLGGSLARTYQLMHCQPTYTAPEGPWPRSSPIFDRIKLKTLPGRSPIMPTARASLWRPAREALELGLAARPCVVRNKFAARVCRGQLEGLGRASEMGDKQTNKQTDSIKLSWKRCDLARSAIDYARARSLVAARPGWLQRLTPELARRMGGPEKGDGREPTSSRVRLEAGEHNGVTGCLCGPDCDYVISAR